MGWLLGVLLYALAFMALNAWCFLLLRLAAPGVPWRPSLLLLGPFAFRLRELRGWVR